MPDPQNYTMNSRAVLAGSNDRPCETRSASPSDAGPAGAAGPAAAVGPKPLRPKKDPMPIAADVDLTQLLASTPPGGAPGPAAAAPAAAAVASPAPSADFDGTLDRGVNIPPDTTGAVSEEHLLSPVNGEMQIFDRAGVSQRSMTLDAFWAPFAAPAAVDTFDPRAVYDPFAKRFIFVTMANATQPDSGLLIAVTKTDDPLADWAGTFVQVDDASQGPVWLDYASVGFTADKITVQVNLFTRDGNQFAGSTIYVFDKQSFYDPPHTPMLAVFVQPDIGGTQVPAVTYDINETTQYLVQRWTPNFNGSGFLAIYEVTGNVSQGTTAFARVGFVEATGAPWQSRSPTGDLAPQKGTVEKIDAGDDRILSAVLRNGALWTSQTVYLPAGAVAVTRSAAQWWQIRTQQWNVEQRGRIDDPSGKLFYAFPTISVNKDDDALIGMSSFAKDQFASASYALRRSSDPKDQMRSPHDYKSGQNTYFKTFGGTDNRWGDYSSTQVDPADDKSFWTVQEYASATANDWATRWAQVT